MEKPRISLKFKTANQMAGISMLMVTTRNIAILRSYICEWNLLWSLGNMIVADPWAGRLYELDLRTLKDKHLTSYYDNAPLHFVNVREKSALLKLIWKPVFLRRMLRLDQIEQSTLPRVHKNICSKYESSSSLFEILFPDSLIDSSVLLTFRSLSTQATRESYRSIRKRRRWMRFSVDWTSQMESFCLMIRNRYWFVKWVRIEFSDCISTGTIKEKVLADETFTYIFSVFFFFFL